MRVDLRERKIVRERKVWVGFVAANTAGSRPAFTHGTASFKSFRDQRGLLPSSHPALALANLSARWLVGRTDRPVSDGTPDSRPVIHHGYMWGYVSMFLRSPEGTAEKTTTVTQDSAVPSGLDSNSVECVGPLDESRGYFQMPLQGMNQRLALVVPQCKIPRRSPRISGSHSRQNRTLGNCYKYRHNSPSGRL